MVYQGRDGRILYPGTMAELEAWDSAGLPTDVGPVEISMRDYYDFLDCEIDAATLDAIADAVVTVFFAPAVGIGFQNPLLMFIDRLRGGHMNKETFEGLKPGDMVVHVWIDGHDTPYVVTANYGDRVTAVASVDITNPVEWMMVRGDPAEGGQHQCASELRPSKEGCCFSGDDDGGITIEQGDIMITINGALARDVLHGDTPGLIGGLLRRIREHG